MDDVFDFFGSQRRLAEAVGVSEAAVSQWARDGKFPPARAIQIEILSEGRFSAIALARGENENASEQ